MLDWHQRHRFCAACGGRACPTTAAGAGAARPAARITSRAPTRGHHADPPRRALSARAQTAVSPRPCTPAWPASSNRARPSRTRCAARPWRRSRSPSGRVAYHASQPWPLPFSQLMIAASPKRRARPSASRTRSSRRRPLVRPRRDRAMRAGTHPAGLTFPTPIAIAHTLLFRLARRHRAGLSLIIRSPRTRTTASA